MKTQFLACVGLLSFLSSVPLRSNLLASDCFAPPKLITPKAMIQVFDLEGHPMAGAHVELSARGKKIGSGEADAQGFVEFVGATPGTYRLSVHVEGFIPYERDMQVVRTGQAPPVMDIVLFNGIECHPSCTVSTSVPLKALPKCLGG